MSGVSAIYFLDTKGKVIIFRNYRGEVTQNVSDNIQKKVLELEEVNMKPVFTYDGVHYCWIKHLNIYIVAVVKRNPNLTLIFAFLHKLVEILIDYFKNLEEESIRDNFVLIYELLDEIMDHGYPQMTETRVLKEFIKTESHELNLDKNASIAIAKTLTNVVSWRTDKAFYKKNEVYLDVIEKVNSLISSTGTVLRSEVIGLIKMKCFLSGMPNLQLGLNDKVLFDLLGRSSKSRTVEMDDLKFHQCVDMNKFESERLIEFVPPDGEFELMNYRFNTQLKPLIWVEVKIDEVSATKNIYIVKAKTNFKERSIANNVDIIIPVPFDLQNPSFKSDTGTVKYNPDKEQFIWNIKQFIGQTEYTMRATFQLPTVRGFDTNKHLKTPIILKYDIPYFTVSGIHVRYLKITEKSNYEALPWVRYITQNGDYQIRMI